MNRLMVRLMDWRAWAPGLESLASWQAWSGETLAVGEPQTSPALPGVNPLFKRRLGQLTRMVIQVGRELMGEGERLPVSFASPHGEVVQQAGITMRLLEEAEVSPAAFSLSVFNTPVSALGIATGNHWRASALFAGEASLAVALLEVLSDLEAHPEGQVLVWADEALPAVYGDLGEAPVLPHALGLRLAAVDPEDPRGQGPARIPLAVQDTVPWLSRPVQLACTLGPAAGGADRGPWPANTRDFLVWLQGGCPGSFRLGAGDWYITLEALS